MVEAKTEAQGIGMYIVLSLAPQSFLMARQFGLTGAARQGKYCGFNVLAALSGRTMETTMTTNLAELFNQETLLKLFPKSRSDDFFEALFGDASEGAYDICLAFVGSPGPKTYNFELQLKQRPGKCLACNLTYGLPEVFSRHPGLNIKGLAAEIGKQLGLAQEEISWKLGVTKSVSNALHTIPFIITV